jgi:nicotinate-nucleotide adenylyltransferase
MRIAFYGGSFDPPHRGHLAVARAAVSRLALDRVLMAPVGVQPLKENGSQASYLDRLAMIELAVEGDSHLSASRLDAPRSDGRPNYTLDTLTALRGTLAPEDKLFCLLGADALFSLRQWHRAPDLLSFCDWIVAARPGFALDEIAALLPDGIRQVEWQRQPGAIRITLAGKGDQEGRQSTLYVLPGLHEDVSATEIRAALVQNSSAGAQVQTVLAPAVAEYIRAHDLYRPPAS